jgi:hypothetical protein
MQDDVDEEGDGAAKMQGRRPVTNVLPGCKGVVQCDGSIQAELGSIQ